MPVFFDDQTEIVDPFHDYIVQLANQKLRELTSEVAEKSRSYRSTIEAASYALKGFLEFLCEQDLAWQAVTDKELELFRNWSLERVKNADNGRHDEKTAARSVNVKLRHIYNFYAWAQVDAFLLADRVGAGNRYPIRSSLAMEREHGKSKAYGHGDNMDDLRYPLLYKRVGGGSKGKAQYTATQKDKDALVRHFTQNCTPEVAERNILIMELADHVGWRCGSLASLLTQQFDWDKINESEQGYIQVTPIVQKFGYTKTFEVPIGIAGRVARYIEGARKKIIEANGWTESAAQDHIWLNMKTGEPLSGPGIVEIFSDAFKAIGCPKGSGLHSLRRKFTQDETVKEIAGRREKGLSTAVEDVQHSTARKLGQNNIHSQEAYQRAIADDIQESHIAKLDNRVKDLEAALAEKELELARLRRLVGE